MCNGISSRTVAAPENFQVGQLLGPKFSPVWSVDMTDFMYCVGKASWYLKKRERTKGSSSNSSKLIGSLSNCHSG